MKQLVFVIQFKIESLLPEEFPPVYSNNFQYSLQKLQKMIRLANKTKTIPCRLKKKSYQVHNNLDFENYHLKDPKS